MNWLRKVGYWDPTQIINDVLNNSGDFDITGAAEIFRSMAPLPPEVCGQINWTAGVNAPARQKMMTLAEAGGCQWQPANPEPAPEMAPQADPGMMPMIGQQEKPMNMPSTEFE